MDNPGIQSSRSCLKLTGNKTLIATCIRIGWYTRRGCLSLCSRHCYTLFISAYCADVTYHVSRSALYTLSHAQVIVWKHIILGQWTIALKIMAEHPILGWGGGETPLCCGITSLLLWWGKLPGHRRDSLLEKGNYYPLNQIVCILAFVVNVSWLQQN